VPAAEPEPGQKGVKGRGKGHKRRRDVAKSTASSPKRGRKPKTLPPADASQNPGASPVTPTSSQAPVGGPESRATKEQERLRAKTAEWLNCLTINNVMMGKLSKTDLYQSKRHKKVCDEKNLNTDAVSLEARLKVMNAASMLTLSEMPKVPVEQLLVS